MPSVENKAYDALIITLVQLGGGIRKHSANLKIKVSTRETELTSIKDELQLLREEYLIAEKKARAAYNEFKMKFKSAQQRVSSETRIIKGILGPKSEDLRDFGINPERSKTSKHKRLFSIDQRLTIIHGKGEL